MSENLRVGMEFPKQSPDMEMLIARGRALRNKMICESCSKMLLRLKKSIGF